MAYTDFRPEPKNAGIPTLIVLGDPDYIVPKASAQNRAAIEIVNNTYEVIKIGPHRLNITHIIMN